MYSVTVSVIEIEMLLTLTVEKHKNINTNYMEVTMKNGFTNWTCWKVSVLNVDMRWTSNEEVLCFVAFGENFPNRNAAKKIWIYFLFN